MDNLFNELLKLGKSRRTAKNYNPEKVVSNEDIKKIYEFALTAPHTMGLELVRHLTFDRNSEFRKDIENQLSGFNKGRAINSSHIGVLITKKGEWFNSENPELIEAANRVSLFGSKARGMDETPKEILEGFINMVASSDFGHNGNNGQEWSAKQAFIQIAYLVLAAKSLNVDTTIMEGFETTMTDYLISKGLIKADERVSLTLLYGVVDDSVENAFIGKEQLRVDLEDFWTAK